MILGPLVNLFRQKLDFEIPLDRIQSIRQDQGARKQIAFSMTTADGEQYDLVATELEDLLSALRIAFNQHPHLQVSLKDRHEWRIESV